MCHRFVLICVTFADESCLGKSGSRQCDEGSGDHARQQRSVSSFVLASDHNCGLGLAVAAG